MVSIKTGMPPGEGLAHLTAATNGPSGASSSHISIGAGCDFVKPLSLAEAEALHRVYGYILSWPLPGGAS